MDKLKKKFTMNRDNEKTFIREFKSGEELNVISYKIPKITKKYTNDDVEEDILNFANYKGEQMSKTEKFKNARINISIEYKSGKWISTGFTTVNKEIILSENMYDDVDIEEMGDIVSFNIQYFI